MLMTADAVGGVWTYASELAGALGELGIEVELAVVGPAPTREQRAGLPELAGYHQHDYALEWMDDAWPDVDRAGDWLLALAHERAVELVHLNGYVHGALDFGRPVVVVGHSCVLSWHEAVHGRPAGRQWERYRVAVTEGLRAAHAVVAPTRAMLRELERLYGASGVVIPNGRSAAGLEPLPKRPYVLGVGRAWDEAKNLAALERAAPQLAWPVVVAGGEVGARELRELYRRAAVFAEPARYEPFGLAALEAALAGCALVLGEIPSLREVWGDAALYVDPFDDETLADTLAWLIRADGLRERLSSAARSRARRYTPDRMASAYAHLYTRLATREEVAA